MGAMNELIDASAVHSAAAILAKAAPGVPWVRTGDAASLLGDLNLRARTDLVAQALQEDIRSVPAAEYPTAAGSFRAALRFPEFTGWILWPVSEAAAALAVDRSG